MDRKGQRAAQQNLALSALNQDDFKSKTLLHSLVAT